MSTSYHEHLTKFGQDPYKSSLHSRRILARSVSFANSLGRGMLSVMIELVEQLFSRFHSWILKSAQNSFFIFVVMKSFVSSASKYDEGETCNQGRERRK